MDNPFFYMLVDEYVVFSQIKILPLYLKMYSAKRLIFSVKYILTLFFKSLLKNADWKEVMLTGFI